MLTDTLIRSGVQAALQEDSPWGDLTGEVLVPEEAVATAQRSTPGVDARGQLVDGPPGRVLLRLSRAANRKLVDIAAAVVDGHALLPKRGPAAP